MSKFITPEEACRLTHKALEALDPNLEQLSKAIHDAAEHGEFEIIYECSQLPVGVDANAVINYLTYCGYAVQPAAAGIRISWSDSYGYEEDEEDEEEGSEDG